MTDCKPTFDEGDRVDHKLFGMGTVSGELVAMVSPDMNSPKGTRPAGYRVPVTWDDSNRGRTEISDWALRKVSSPDSRPYTHWRRQWQPIFDEWIDARRAVESMLREFRPPPNERAVAELQARESAAYAEVQRFFRAEAEGKHP